MTVAFGYSQCTGTSTASSDGSLGPNSYIYTFTTTGSGATATVTLNFEFVGSVTDLGPGYVRIYSNPTNLISFTEVIMNKSGQTYTYSFYPQTIGVPIYCAVKFAWAAGGLAVTKVFTFTPGQSNVTPTFTQAAAVCSGATMTALPTTSTNSLTGTWSPALNNTATTLYTFTPTGSACVNTTTMSVTVNPLPTAPTASAQTFCAGSTVSNLAATGTGIQWYSASTGGSAFTGTETLATGTYYASQTVSTCESTRTAVTVTVNTTAPPTASPQTFCAGSTVSNLAATGATIKWYSASTGGTALAGTATLATGTYYASQTLSTCESTRTAVYVTVNTPIATVGVSPAAICSGAISVTMKGSVGPVGATGTWTGGTGTWTSPTDPYNAQYTPSAGESGNITLTLTASLGSCSATNSKTIVANAIGTLSADQLIPSGTIPAALTLTGNSGGVLKWQKRTTPFTTWTPINITPTTYTPPTALTQTTQYSVLVKNSPCSGNPISNIITITIDSRTWTGNVDTTWNTAGNWFPTSVPTSTTDVTIAAVTNQPTISTDVTIYSLNIATGMTLTVATGSDLTVTNVITNVGTGTMVVQNNANLIQTNPVANSGTITVNRDSAPLLRLDLTMWSSPVTGTQKLKDFSPATLSNRFFTYDTQQNLYLKVADPSISTFSAGKGYAIRASNVYPSNALTTFHGAFTGVPNNGNISVTLPFYPPDNVFSLVGNPYPSTISIPLLLAGNPTIEGTFYFYTHSYSMNATTGIWSAGTNYATYTSGSGITVGTTQGDSPHLPNALGLSVNGTIQVGQGFFVRALSGGSLTFTNSMRTKNHANQFMRTAPIEKHSIWLNLKTDTGRDINQMNVGYIEGATQGVDTNFDGLAFGNSGSYLLSKLEGLDYAIQGRSLPFASNDVVPLTFNAATAGNYMLSLTKTDGLFAGSQDVFVRDNLMGIDHNIKVSPYTFASDAGTFDSRFELVYTQALGIPSTNFTPNSVIVYKNTDWFHVNTKGILMKEIQVYDISGRLIFKQSNINATTTVLNGLTETNEVLFLKITSEDDVTVTVKVIN